MGKYLIFAPAKGWSKGSGTLTWGVQRSIGALRLLSRGELDPNILQTLTQRLG